MKNHDFPSSNAQFPRRTSKIPFLIPKPINPLQTLVYHAITRELIRVPVSRVPLKPR
jgi:hypothetical protein